MSFNNTSLANNTRPKKFKDYICAENSGVELIKHLIKDNLHSNTNKVNDFSITVLLIEGGSGVGKTSLSNLYARATLCPNRPQGEYEPCGECEVCTGLDNSNIYEYTIKSSTEARDVIHKLVEQSYCTPIRTTGREDQFRQFIILDELENATPELISSYLLKPLEDNPNTTSWILSTMDLEKLERRNPIVKEAIASRSTIVSLQKFTKEQIGECLEKVGGINIEAGVLIAGVCNGNLREAWKEAAKLSILAKVPLNKLTKDLVIKYLMGGMTPDLRKTFWTSFKNNNPLLVKSFLSDWSSKVSQKTISNILVEDLLSSPLSPSSSLLLNSLISWYNSTISYDISLVFLKEIGKGRRKTEEREEEKGGEGEGIPYYIKEKRTKKILEHYKE